MLGTFLGDVALQRLLYLAAKPFHMRVDVDGLACSLHRLTSCSHQMRGQGYLSGAVLSCHCSGPLCLSKG
jgi:hypothetical protein